MRANIHPEYREVLFHDTNANSFFVIGSTLQSHQTREHEGKTYPYVSLDISSASHIRFIPVNNVKPVMKVVLQASINVSRVSNAHNNFIFL